VGGKRRGFPGSGPTSTYTEQLLPQWSTRRSRTRAVRLVGQWKNWRGRRRTGPPVADLLDDLQGSQRIPAVPPESWGQFLEPAPRWRSTPGPPGDRLGAFVHLGREKAGSGERIAPRGRPDRRTAIGDVSRAGPRLPLDSRRSTKVSTSRLFGADQASAAVVSTGFPGLARQFPIYTGTAAADTSAFRHAPRPASSQESSCG